VNIAFNEAEDRILVWGSDGAARLFDALTGRQIGAVLRHGRRISGALILSEEGSILTWGDDGALRRWSGVSREAFPPISSPGMASALFSSNGSRLFTTSGDWFALWNAASGESAGEAVPSGELLANPRTPDRMLEYNLYSSSPQARIRSRATGAVQHDLGVTDLITDADLSPDGSVAVLLFENRLGRWRMADGAALEPVRLPDEGYVIQHYLSDDGARVLLNMSNGLFFWDASDRRLRRLRLTEPIGDEVGDARADERMRASLAFSPRGTHFFFADEDGVARIRQIGAATQWRLRGDYGRVNEARFSEDGNLVAIGRADGRVQLWAFNQPEAPLRSMQHDGGSGVTEVTFSPNGSQEVLSLAGDEASLWDGEAPERIMRHVGTIRGASFSPDGSRILTFGTDMTLRLWDAETGRQITPSHRHQETIRGAAFSLDGDRVVSWSSDGLVYVWGASWGEGVTRRTLREEVCGRFAQRTQERGFRWPWQARAGSRSSMLLFDAEDVRIAPILEREVGHSACRGVRPARASPRPQAARASARR
jgi:WD40 repeat protein